jgi:carbon monoxide dehydrogenase subunit G
MTVKVTIDLKRKFAVVADIDSVFALLSNVAVSASHFPKVKLLTDLGENKFRWEMEKVGLGSHAIQTTYACQYVSDDAGKSVVWSPVEGEGNSLVSGKWQLTENGQGTDVCFETNAVLTLPLPGLLKLMIGPLVKHEFTSMVDTYIGKLKRVLV